MASIRARLSEFCEANKSFQEGQSARDFVEKLYKPIDGGVKFTCNFCDNKTEYKVTVNGIHDCVKGHLVKCTSFLNLFNSDPSKVIQHLQNLKLPRRLDFLSKPSSDQVFRFDSRSMPVFYYDRENRRGICSYQPPSDPSFVEVGNLSEVKIKVDSAPTSSTIQPQLKRTLQSSSQVDLLQPLVDFIKRPSVGHLQSPTKSKHTYGHLIQIQDKVNEKRPVVLSECKQFFATHEEDEVTLVICKLCIAKCSTLTTTSGSGNVTNSMKAHLISRQHNERFDEFLLEPWRFPHLQRSLNFMEYATLVDESTIAEGMMALYSVKSGTPFRSMTILSPLIRCLRMDRNFHCSETKLAALIKVVLNRVAFTKMKEEISQARCVTIHHDTTTLHNTKVLVIMAKYFDPRQGVQVRCLDVRSIIGETAEDLCGFIQEAMDNAGLTNDKVKALVADNTNTNFGGSKQVAGNNVAPKLEQQFGHGIFRLGCLAHIDNNTFRHVCDHLKEAGQFNLSKSLNQPFGYFHQKVKQFDAFQRHWRELGNPMSTFSPLRSFAETRWLSALNSLTILDKMYPALRSFFSVKAAEPRPSNETTELNEFFAEDINYCWFGLMKQFAIESHRVAGSIQGRTTTIMTGLALMEQFLSFCSRENREASIMKLIEGESMGDRMTVINEEQQATLKAAANNILQTGEEYLKKWLMPFQELRTFHWATLKSPIITAMVFETLKTFRQHEPSVPTLLTNPDRFQLEAEVAFINDVMDHWRQEESAPNCTSERWVEMFRLAQAQEPPIQLVSIEPIVCDLLAMSPSNALSETIFSEIGHYWTDSKASIDFISIYAFINIRFNMNISFEEFRELIREDRRLLMDIRSTNKYKELKSAKEVAREIRTDLLASNLVPARVDEVLEAEVVFDNFFDL